MNPLNENPRARRAVYTVFWLVGLLLGSASVAFAAADVAQPVQLDVAQAVFVFLGAGIGYTASLHTPKPDVDLSK